MRTLKKILHIPQKGNEEEKKEYILKNTKTSTENTSKTILGKEQRPLIYKFFQITALRFIAKLIWKMVFIIIGIKN